MRSWRQRAARVACISPAARRAGVVILLLCTTPAISAAAAGPDWLACPVPELRTAYRTELADRADPAALVEVEREILTLCAERAAVVQELLMANEQIAVLRAAAHPAPARNPTVPAATSSTVSGALSGWVSVPTSADPGPVPAAAASLSAPVCPEPVTLAAVPSPLPAYQTGAVYGRAGALRAVLWRQGVPFTAEAGTALPGAVQVTTITPEGVSVRGAAGEHQLPWR